MSVDYSTCNYIPKYTKLSDKHKSLKPKIKSLTIKQSRVVNLVKSGKVSSLSEGMRQSDYAESTVHSEEVRLPIKKALQDHFSPEKIKDDSSKIFEMAEKKRDITNMQRNTEFRANVAGMIRQKVDQTSSTELRIIDGNSTNDDDLLNIAKNIRARVSN